MYYDALSGTKHEPIPDLSTHPGHTHASHVIPHASDDGCAVVHNKLEQLQPMAVVPNAYTVTDKSEVSALPPNSVRAHYTEIPNHVLLRLKTTYSYFGGFAVACQGASTLVDRHVT